MKRLQKEVSQWQNKTFGTNRGHGLGLFNHLVREVQELGDTPIDSKNFEGEFADCVILLIGLADAYSVDLEKAVKEKMKENRKRKWNKPDKDGVIQHIK